MRSASHTQEETAGNRLQAAIDRSEILDALARYCRGVDRLDVELIDSVYHSKAYDDHIMLQANAPEIGKRLVEMMAGMATSSLHFITPPTIQLAGDRAFSETYWMSKHLRMVDGAEWRREANGRYLDSWEREDGQWKIIRRECILESVHLVPGEDPDPALRSKSIRRDRDDPSYKIL